MAYDFTVRSRRDLVDAVREFGIVPYFHTSIPGFSLEEHCPPEILFNDTEENTWEWKGPVIRETGCAYGKFFEKKASYVRRDLFLDLANCRRDGYDFDARYDDGLARFEDKQLYELIDRNAPVLSRDLRRAGGYAAGVSRQTAEGKKGFDGSVLRLQELCYVLVSDFVYTTDRNGNRCGWGVAEYSTPEKFMGEAFTENVYRRTPEESRLRLLEHLSGLFPQAGEKQLRRLLK